MLNDRFVLLLGPFPSFTSVMRLRLRPDEVESTVAEVRGLIAERLRGLGFVPRDQAPGDDALLMIGGGTLPHARGRGAYRALVRARWDDAVERGTPALVTQAGAMSRPILERLGFVPVSETQLLLDAGFSS